MRVLVVSASVGAGHTRAGEAVAAALNLEFSNTSARHVNVLDYVTPNFRRFYQDGYKFLVDRLPGFWGKIYRAMDQMSPSSPAAIFMDRCQIAQAEAFFRLIDEYQPTVIIATHFLVPQILGASRHASLPVDVVITDFRLHRIWLHPNVRKYYVAAPITADDLKQAGIPNHRISVTGIPVHHSFSERFHLRVNNPAVVVMGGGSGIGRLEKTVAALLRTEIPMDIIVVAGNNRQVLAKLAELPQQRHVRLVSLGYVSNMAQIFANASMVITKAGGLTVSECLAMGVPMVLFPCMPGQESANADYVVQEGAGVRAGSATEAAATVKSLLTDTARLSRMARRARAVGAPLAAFDVIRQTLPLSFAA